MSDITISLAAAPAAISDSVRTVLVAHGYVVIKIGYTVPDNKPVPIQLTEEETIALLRECGNNAAQSLIGLDKAEGDGDGDGEP